jgi:hypothetical protein
MTMGHARLTAIGEHIQSNWASAFRGGESSQPRMYCCRALDLFRELGDWLGEVRTQK